MPMNKFEITRRILTGARDLLADESRWVQGPIAENAAGEEVHATAADACTWCSLGALYKEFYDVFPDHDSAPHSEKIAQASIQDSTLEYLREHIVRHTDEIFDDIAYYNDHECHDHGDVLAVFDLAIEGLGKEGE